MPFRLPRLTLHQTKLINRPTRRYRTTIPHTHGLDLCWIDEIAMHPDHNKAFLSDPRPSTQAGQRDDAPPPRREYGVERGLGTLEPEEIAHVVEELQDPTIKTQRKTVLLTLVGVDLKGDVEMGSPITPLEESPVEGRLDNQPANQHANQPGNQPARPSARERLMG